ncbi:2-hydroxyacid dehydrogenase [Maritimibacter alkaliphilus]|uniref:2-hydroxyacid dehydrogenase n=1 Tax=Maritimibacter alkaliphilus TaxID=404236 RepID=UPI001C978229|nr:glyoxylate/hydroxypyruvate reductase A [Maritimibacter alkaliphilus]MBY6092252.1 glyoxylate/hydroxypyruvate reductase A [Maritimibacter alkaliphilus]
MTLDSTGGETFDVVALSVPFDLLAMFGPDAAPRVNLINPEDVTDPEAIRYALCWCPADDAFARFPNVELAMSIAAGVDAIVACPSLPDGAVVGRVRDEDQAQMMAGFAVWNVIHHHRRMGDMQRNHAAGLWDRSFSPRPPREVTVGVLGFGLMGRACAEAIAAAGFTVVAARHRDGPSVPGIEQVCGPDAVDRVAARADILVNVLPLTESTRDILDARLFALMPKGAVLVHIGRGEHMVEEDLLAALESGQISAASLDVFRQEPLPEGHPFWTHPAVVMTPHKASVSTKAETIRQLVENCEAIRAGRPAPGAVDRAAGY